MFVLMVLVIVNGGGMEPRVEEGGAGGGFAKTSETGYHDVEGDDAGSELDGFGWWQGISLVSVVR